MFAWTANIDVVSMVLGAALGAVLGTMMSTWHSYYVRRPKLEVTGGGGGGGPQRGYQRHITVRNSPGLVGFKLSETTIFGKSIHNHIEVGLVVDRSPAHECHASLYDKATKQHVAPLWWRTQDGTMTRAVTLKSGESASLMLFARGHNDRRKYFVHQLKNGASNELLIPDDEDKLEGSRDFYILIQHSYGKKTFRTECSIIQGFDGKLRFQSKGGGGGSF